MIAIERIFYAYLDEIQVITILLPKNYHDGQSSKFYLIQRDYQELLTIKEKIELEDSIKYICISPIPPEIGQTYEIIDEYGEKTDLQIGAVIRTKEFDEQFYYDGWLGVKYNQTETVVKLWAPTATKVKLKLMDQDGKHDESVDMIREEQGVWSVNIQKDLESYHYSFLVCINLEWREAVDPYAVAVTANGEIGVIVDLNKTSIKRNPILPLCSPVDAIIYETHIRDLTIHPNSGARKKGTYVGASEVGTKTRMGHNTGLSYLKELGVTHIEFLPFNDFEGVNELGDKSDYNWGYNPTHFNVPEGSYSSNPNNPYARIIELKKMIQGVHEQGLGVIMDVVFNHVYIRETSSFEKIVPGYYFRHDQYGMPSNGTGVGNDIASERLMVRKFIIDSVRFWKKEYDMDGFRFDLMGILDVETMNAVRKAIDEVDPSTIIIGEGWDLNTPIPIEKKASIRNQSQLPRIGQFNDWFRDSIKGSTFNIHDRGYVLGTEHYFESAKQLLAGSIGLGKKEKGLFLEPIQSVNYIESHDNHTFWDKLSICGNGIQEDILKRQHRLATTMVLLSQGIPFLHSGQEFFRTKKGIGNSYRSPNEINWLDWDLRDENDEHVQYIKGIIAIRKSHQAFRLPTAQLIRKHLTFIQTTKPVIGYMLQQVSDYGNWEKIIALFNPLMEDIEVELPEGDWKILSNENKASGNPIGEQPSKIIPVKAVSSFVLVK
ncbi:type I pullulanase [Bacillus sp. 31A1R]|uniref:Type I pullulanase n=1 Tax=Robertmurraya mangrovi TaxID=3098077 RepID=A0ABU5IZN3_9BACI|nr:type I pullulanase [Bacillus sp. 31A1R]MDZ5472570.1 type I pullulanase [Bacillus sp. 31A1R]